MLKRSTQTSKNQHKQAEHTADEKVFTEEDAHIAGSEQTGNSVRIKGQNYWKDTYRLPKDSEHPLETPLFMICD